MPVMPGAEPFSADPEGAEIGVVLAHGFTGSPQSMRPWGEHLTAAGFAVRGPRLPGHGTHWRDMQATRWPDWYGEIARATDELLARYDTVLVFGLSMGGTLTLRIAEEYGSAIAGICLVNPSVTTLRRDAAFARYLARLWPWAPGVANDVAKPGVTELGYDRVPLRAFVSLTELWTTVRADLARVTSPVLLYRSTDDHVVEPVNARLVLDGVSATDVAEVVLHDSYHVATLDHDALTIFTGSTEFARRRHAARTTSGKPA
ncbi:alpha/beta fold hydrolase [Actinomycetospora sp. OC33-EN08]|uniref:Alpha/beta fold hydrolase n=1 Tax=Actinomycetospora aurantiaca TaxID=3129233 RepID=A0ABU8MV98_9PSEU